MYVDFGANTPIDVWGLRKKAACIFTAYAYTNVYTLYLIRVCVCVCAQGHIQVTFVEPYFEEWELKDRLSVFDRAFNIRELVNYKYFFHKG